MQLKFCWWWYLQRTPREEDSKRFEEVICSLVAIHDIHQQHQWWHIHQCNHIPIPALCSSLHHWLLVWKRNIFRSWLIDVFYLMPLIPNELNIFGLVPWWKKLLDWCFDGHLHSTMHLQELHLHLMLKWLEEILGGLFWWCDSIAKHTKVSHQENMFYPVVYNVHFCSNKAIHFFLRIRVWAVSNDLWFWVQLMK